MTEQSISDFISKNQTYGGVREPSRDSVDRGHRRFHQSEYQTSQTTRNNPYERLIRDRGRSRTKSKELLPRVEMGSSAPALHDLHASLFSRKPQNGYNTQKSIIRQTQPLETQKRVNKYNRQDPYASLIPDRQIEDESHHESLIQRHSYHRAPEMRESGVKIPEGFDPAFATVGYEKKRRADQFLKSTDVQSLIKNGGEMTLRRQESRQERYVGGYERGCGRRRVVGGAAGGGYVLREDVVTGSKERRRFVGVRRESSREDGRVGYGLMRSDLDHFRDECYRGKEMSPDFSC